MLVFFILEAEVIKEKVKPAPEKKGLIQSHCTLSVVFFRLFVFLIRSYQNACYGCKNANAFGKKQSPLNISSLFLFRS